MKRSVSSEYTRILELMSLTMFEEASSVTMNIFRKKNLFKSFVKLELSYVFTINMFSTTKSCMEK